MGKKVLAVAFSNGAHRRQGWRKKGFLLSVPPLPSLTNEHNNKANFIGLFKG